MRAIITCLLLAAWSTLGFAEPAPNTIPAEKPPEAPASATTDNTAEMIKLGNDAYEFGDYGKTLKYLVPLVEPEQRITQVEVRVKVYRVIGLSHFFLKNPEQASTYFEKMIRLRPDEVLDSVITPPEAVNLFEKLKKKLAPEIAKIKRELELRRQVEEEKLRRESIRYLPIQVNSRLIAALPFGAGQFQNGDAILGAAFLGTEVAAISVSLASFLAVESLRGADGRFRNADVEQARSYQQLQLVSGGIGLAIVAAGIIEAMISYRPRLKAGEPSPYPLTTGVQKYTSPFFSVSF